MSLVDTHAVVPSPEARRLFGQMVANAEGDELHLPIESTLALSVQRVREGKWDKGAVAELLDEGWIQQAPSGGWLLQ